MFYADGSIKGVNNSMAGRVNERPPACAVCHNATLLDEVIITSDDNGGGHRWFDDPSAPAIIPAIPVRDVEK